METKELSEIVTVALQNIIESEVTKRLQEKQKELVDAFLKNVTKEDFETVMKTCGRDDLLSTVERDKMDIVKEVIEEDKDAVIGLLDTEDIAKDWIENNPSEAGDIVNDNIYDSDARDLVENLISSHW